MEKKKNNTGLKITILILSLLLVLAIGYIAKEKLEKENKNTNTKDVTEEKTQKDENFYSVENLIKNHYIKKIETTKIEDQIEIKNNEVYYNKNEKMKKDETLTSPKYVHYAVYELSTISGYFALTNTGDLYYLEMDQEKLNNKPEFTKINTKKVVNLYTNVIEPSLDTIYAEFEDGSLMHFENKTFEKTYQEKNKYPDKIYKAYASGGTPALLIDENKKVYNENQEKILYNNKEITLKNGYTILQDAYSLIIDEENNLLKVPYDNVNVSLYKNEKVKNTNFTKNDETAQKGKLTITLENGETINFDEVTTDTIYTRNNQ